MILSRTRSICSIKYVSMNVYSQCGLKRLIGYCKSMQDMLINAYLISWCIRHVVNDSNAPITLYSSVKYDWVKDYLILRSTDTDNADQDNTFCHTTQFEYLKDVPATQYSMESECTQSNRF
jgi:hypothetical protein